MYFLLHTPSRSPCPDFYGRCSELLNSLHHHRFLQIQGHRTEGHLVKCRSEAVKASDKQCRQTRDFCLSSEHQLMPGGKHTVLLLNDCQKLDASYRSVTHPLGICNGCRSPTGNPSEVKYFSSSLASNNGMESRGPSLWPSNRSDDRGNEAALGKQFVWFY